MYPNKANDMKSRDMKNAKDNVVDDLEDAAVATRQQLKTMARETGAQVQSFLTGKKEQIAEARETAERTIKANPFTTTVTAFATGLLLGRLLKRH